MYKYIHTNTTNGFLLISGSPSGLSCLSCIQIHIKHRCLYRHPTHCDSFARSLSFSLSHTHSLSLCLSQRLVNLIWHERQSKCFSNFPTVWLSLSLSFSLSVSTYTTLPTLPLYPLYSFYVCVNTFRCCSLSLLLCLLSTTISTTLKHCVMECAAFSTTKY